MTLIAICITLIYLILIGSLVYGFDKVPDFTLKDLAPKTKFSIIVPFRNEEKNLPALLESISKLNYPKELFEIIFVDDDSDDDSLKVLNTMKVKSSTNRFDIHIISNIRTSNSPKKDAITTAILKAKFNWIVTTDADCEVPRFWLDSFDEYIQRHQPEFIVAPVTYSKYNTFLYRFQLLDVSSLQGATIGGFGIGQPFLCNGANLAYKKELFGNVKGFHGNDTIGSGDDIFMLEKVVKQYPNKAKYLKCEQAIVSTLPQPNFDSLISQRVRWAAKTSSYHNWFGKLTGIMVFLMNGGLLIFGLLTLAGIINLKILLYLLVIKFGIDFLLIYKAAVFTSQKDVLKSYFFAFLLYPFFSTYVAFLSLFKGYQWKGRKYSK